MTKIKPKAEQGLMGYLRDAYYNFRFKARQGVTTPKQIAVSLHKPFLEHDAHALSSRNSGGNDPAYDVSKTVFPYAPGGSRSAIVTKEDSESLASGNQNASHDIE